MVDTLKLMSITQRETDTLLAALRFWQAYNQAFQMPGARIDAIREIAGDDPLDDPEIDNLCGRINQ